MYEPVAARATVQRLRVARVDAGKVATAPNSNQTEKVPTMVEDISTATVLGITDSVTCFIDDLGRVMTGGTMATSFSDEESGHAARSG